MSISSTLTFLVLGALSGVIIGVVEDAAEDRGYARGVRDCQAGTPSYTVTVENGVTDTTYVYPSK